MLRRNGQEEVADADPLKRKIDWGRVREVVFGSENMVQVITTGVATNIVVITGYVLAGKSLHHLNEKNSEVVLGVPSIDRKLFGTSQYGARFSPNS